MTFNYSICDCGLSVKLFLRSNIYFYFPSDYEMPRQYVLENLIENFFRILFNHEILGIRAVSRIMLLLLIFFQCYNIL